VQHHPDGLGIFQSSSIPQEKLRLAGLWEFRSAAEAAMMRIVGLFQERPGVSKQFRSQLPPGRRLPRRALRQTLLNVRGGSDQVVAPRFPEFVDMPQKLQKTRPALAVVGGK